MVHVLSRNKFLTTRKILALRDKEIMRKLNLRKVRWIVREMKKRDPSVYQIARQQGITQRYVRMLQVSVPSGLFATPGLQTLRSSTVKSSITGFYVSPLQSTSGSFSSAIEASYVYNGVHYSSMRPFAVTENSGTYGTTINPVLGGMALIIIALIILIINSIIIRSKTKKSWK